jgi:SAM-dependent methyltransferase
MPSANLQNSSRSNCTCCAHDKFCALPILPQTIISDGQIWPKPLKKHICENCGATAHITPLTDEDIQEIYSAPYSLGGHHSPADIQRAENYKKWILETLDKISSDAPKNILEIGCGNGLLAKNFKDFWPSANLYGIEPAAQATTQAQSLGIDVFQGILEELDLGHLKQKIDLIYSVNVIEHSLDPVIYLKRQKELLSDNGIIIAICPNATQPNIETLFYDHVTGFTQKSLSEVAKRSGLVLTNIQTAPPAIGNFQIAIFKNTGALAETDNKIDQIIRDKKLYYDHWKILDQNLCAKGPNKNTIMFGAGEMGSIIRGLAPQFWSKISAVTLDTPTNDCFHEKKIVALDTLDTQKNMIFIAVRPDFGNIVETRLKDTGFETDSIHHYISH